MPRKPHTASLLVGESVYLTLPLLLPSPARTPLWDGSYLVGTETLQGVVSKLVSHIHQIIVGVDVVQAVGFCFARGFAHILAVPKETVEVEFVGILAVCCQAGITGIHPKPNHHLHSFHTFVSLPRFNSRGAQAEASVPNMAHRFPIATFLFREIEAGSVTAIPPSYCTFLIRIIRAQQCMVGSVVFEGHSFNLKFKGNTTLGRGHCRTPGIPLI